MAGSKEKKNQKPETNFVDDLDSMLSGDDAANQSASLIDDDDAIDRLLINDEFGPEISSDDEDMLAMDDVDQLLADDTGQDNAMSDDFDEFGDDIDDLIADIQINPKQQKTEITETPVFDESTPQDSDPYLPETDVLLDEFVDDEALEVADPIVTNDADEELAAGADDALENMAEIDEFSDEADSASADNTDFLMADFDISADDDLELDGSEAVVEVESPEEPSPDEAVESRQAIVDSEENVDDQGESESGLSEQADLSEAENDLTVEPEDTDNQAVANVPAEPAPDSAQPNVDYSALIAGLTAQLTALKKQQTKIGQDIQGKGNKEELTACLENIDALQGEQKKAKRALDELNKRKPVAAYVANGLAIIALVVGGSLGYQGYQAKNQAAQIIEYLGKMQSQINAAPSADNAEKEMLRNQLDELARADSIASEQIAELMKAVQGDGSNKTTAAQGSQPGELMQMGAAIESLQAKVAALEKGKVPAPVAKPPQKKPVVIQENWVVNLVAFKQDWYAKRKAEEYVSKGVPAKVNKTESKGETWYRLSVDGFKSQYEAAAYAARVKKTLNLDSVWVNKSK